MLSLDQYIQAFLKGLMQSLMALSDGSLFVSNSLHVVRTCAVLALCALSAPCGVVNHFFISSLFAL